MADEPNVNRNTQTISTANFTETPRLVLEQPVGDITIEGWDNPAVEVTDADDGDFDIGVLGNQITVRSAHRHKRRFNEAIEPAIRELDRFGVNAERIASRVERQVERGMRRMRHGFNIELDLGRWTGSRDYRIKVPHNCDLMLRTSSGDIYIKDVTGTMFVQTTSGDLQMHRVSGNLLVSSASGDMNLRNVSGKLGARTASGDLLIEQAELQELGVQSASGDIRAYLQRVPEREFQVQTVSGDVMVWLPSNARLTAELRTMSGELMCRFPHDLIKRSGSRVTTLTINGGGTTAQFASVSGDVTLRPQIVDEGGARTTDLSRTESEEGESESTDDITEPEGYASRQQAELDILQAVERGEITSQEALQRLSELGR
jgi:Toastrack DUF4097